MDTTKCELCGERRELLDAVVNTRQMQICEHCARFNDVILLRVPSEKQIVEAEKPYSVRERLSQFQPDIAIAGSAKSELGRVRKMRGMTQEELAEALGVTHYRIKKAEMGEAVNEVFARKVEQFLGVKLGNVAVVNKGVKKMGAEKGEGERKSEEEKRGEEEKGSKEKALPKEIQTHEEKVEKVIKRARDGVEIDFKSRDITLRDLVRVGRKKEERKQA